MAILHYTFEQLQHLRQSPLVRKPENLLTIEQWIDQATEQNQRKSRVQATGQTSKSDENEHPAKRPSVFESRQLSRNSITGAGDDVFLGPKISFASASAARQPRSNVTQDERPRSPPHENARARNDRFVVRDKSMRDREEYQRSRRSYPNGQYEGSEDRPRVRAHRDTEREDERSLKHKNGNLPDRQIENHELDARRNGHNTGRFEQPWFRDNSKDERRDSDTLKEDNGNRLWRESNRRHDREGTRGGRSGQDPQWFNPSDHGDPQDHTQDDFQKWKEQMRAGANSDEKQGPAVEPHSDEVQASAADSTFNNTSTVGESTVDQFFGLWGDNKREDKRPENQSGTKSKSSRFAGFFAPTMRQQAQPSTTEPASASLPQSPIRKTPSRHTAEDQEGFQRMMEMLRTGGPSQQQSTDSLAPLLTAPPIDAEQARKSAMKNLSGHNSSLPLPDLLESTDQRGRGSRPSGVTSGSDASSKETEFLRGLMQQPTLSSRTPFSESQIYGQTFSRKHDDDISSLLNNYAAKAHVTATQAPPKMKGPPPGLFTNEISFNTNQQIDPRTVSDQSSQPRPRSVQASDIYNVQDRAPRTRLVEVLDDRFDPGAPPRRQTSTEELIHRQQSEQHRFQQPPTLEPWSPNGFIHSNRHPLEGVAPPPGFHAGGRGPAAPGFFPFNGSSVATQHNGPPGLRAPTVQQNPGFFNTLQGYAASENQGRRAQVPGYGSQALHSMGDSGRRLPGPAPVGQGQYPQYMRQSGAAGAYQGMR